MFSTCLFCHSRLGANESIEAFPVGRRLAFDPLKGRLWVVCGACGRWNLAPLEERWEAIEAAEKLYRDTRLRVATDQMGLARLRDGTELNVERDWHAPIGSVSCGPDAHMDDPTPAAIALRDVVCAIARRGIFHHILSPSWDAAHHNHLHLDIARNASRQAMH